MRPGGPCRAPGAGAIGIGALAALLVLAGCARLPFGPDGSPQSATAPAPAESIAAPQDPLLAFAAGAAPGAQGVVGGQRVRVQRAYVAASGRECRELLIGSGVAERSSLVCRDGAGWVQARPLLRGGGGGGGGTIVGALRP